MSRVKLAMYLIPYANCNYSKYLIESSVADDCAKHETASSTQ